MWNQVVLAALIPAMMAKPIAPRGEMTGVQESHDSPVFDSAVLRNNTLMAIAKAMEVENSDSAEEGTSQNSQMTQVERRQISPSQLSDLSNHAASTIFNGASAGVMSWATSVGNAMSTGHPLVPRAGKGRKAKATSTPTPTPTPSASGTATASNSAHPTASNNCNCISACADEDGKATQMQCMKKCSADCDGDDDKKKDSDILGGLGKSLLGSLGGRSIPAPPPMPPHRKFTHPRPAKTVHEAAGAEFEDFDACMNSCKTHNCKHSEVGLAISQCGDTSCEDACAKFKSSKSRYSKSIQKKHIRPVADRVKADTPLPKPKKPVAAATHNEAFENCMKKCQSHNCQHSEVGISISQCGDTSCMESCAKYKEGQAMIITRQARQPGKTGDVPDVADVPDVPTVATVPEVPPTPEVAEVPVVAAVPEVPEVKGGPIKAATPASAPVPAPATHGAPKHHGLAPGHESVPVKGVAQEGEYEACLKECKTHNCQKSGVGLDIEQCGDTSCVDACASLKESAHAGVSAHKVKVPSAPGRLADHPGPDPPVVKTVPEAGAHESKEFQDCVKQCKTHNCQKADIGLEVSQCGDTSCSESCAHLKEGKAAHIAGAPRAMDTAAAEMTTVAAPGLTPMSVSA
ncbi:hypothetical protein F4813DRAFT_41838 [Daldinia decipiens]|uniref:uncharacterized protein n=1 Tax=Daldinia decipiens TaxID=326647 RepID=UPI0020C4048B|nr:uncharacterized protein F4813DRAFT_41838 [Daldinia decipiens]KAI1658681.1 hypothetical protein F4813DRAFT_41838 [Daldinia decipiens]